MNDISAKEGLAKLLIVLGLAASIAACSTAVSDGPGGQEGDPRGSTVARGCVPEDTEPPCAEGAAVGQRYPYQLYTHCGVQWAYFDGRWWRAEPLLNDGSGNPPSAWGNPFQDGTMVLAERDRLRFEAESLAAEFRPYSSSKEYPGELCY